MARRCLPLFVLAAALVGACHPGYSPELHVLGIHGEPVGDVVFVEVTNPAKHAMRLTKLEYKFAADGATVSTGALALAREVPAGAAVVVEIPLDSQERPLTMSGTLTTELDQIIQSVSVSAEIETAQPEAQPAK